MVTSIGADQFPIVIGTYVHAGTRGREREEGRTSKNKNPPPAAEAGGRGLPMGKYRVQRHSSYGNEPV